MFINLFSVLYTLNTKPYTIQQKLENTLILCQILASAPLSTCWHSLISCRPDMTFAVDWALSNNYLSISHFSSLVLCRVLSLFLSYPGLLLAHSPDLFFTKPPFFKR